MTDSAQTPGLPASAASNAIAVEVHYYADGLRREHFPRGSTRPAWLPPADNVGLTDEYSPAEGEHAVEWCRLVANGEKVTWFAVYGSAIDAGYGNRRNHAGIGVWLRGDVECDPAVLINSLAVVLDNSKIRAGTLDEKLDDTAAQFVAFVTKRLRAVSPIWQGLSYGSGSLHNTARFQTPRADDPYAPIGQHMFAATRSLKALPHNRCLYAISNAELTGFAAIPSALAIDSNVFDHFADHVADLQKQLAALDQSHAAAQQMIARLEADNLGNQHALAARDQEIAALKDSLAIYSKEPIAAVDEVLRKLDTKVSRLTERINAAFDGDAGNDIITRLDAQRDRLIEVQRSLTVIGRQAPSLPAHQPMPGADRTVARPSYETDTGGGGFWQDYRLYVLIGVPLVATVSATVLYLSRLGT